MFVVSRRNFGFRISDFGFSNPVRASNPQSAIRNPQSRAAISLTEVLIAMGILTLGLLGVASLFPVGGYYMQKAETADTSSMVAQSAMNELVTRGMLNPKSWFAMTPAPRDNNLGSPNFVWDNIDGKYIRTTGVPNAVLASFTRPLAEAIAGGRTEAIKLPVAQREAALCKQFGSAYVIDPMWCAAITQFKGTELINRYAYAFPSGSAVSYPSSATGTGVYYSNSGWNPWRSTTTAKPANRQAWPIRRVTFRQPSTGWPLDPASAESLFRCADDLAVDLPPRADRPAAQMWDVSNNTPMARQWKGDYSWIATVAPSTSAARDLIASSPESVEALVSVVVLHKRVLPPQNATNSDVPLFIAGERSVSASVISTGLTGGELLLREAQDGGNPGTSFDNLKAGNWIMLCGPHPNTSLESPKFFMNWYQVLSIDKEAAGVITDSSAQRLVTVRGAEWPWQPKSPWNDYTTLSNDLCVGIIKGAVAVHTKTLRLEGAHSASSGGAAPMGMTGGPEVTGGYWQ